MIKNIPDASDDSEQVLRVNNLSRYVITREVNYV